MSRRLRWALKFISRLTHVDLYDDYKKTQRDQEMLHKARRMEMYHRANADSSDTPSMPTDMEVLIQSAIPRWPRGKE